MSFELRFSEEAVLQLKKLDNKAAKRILIRLQEASGNPLHFLERLAGREEFKLRIGDYRAIVRILHKENAIFVQSVGHRKNIYTRART